MCYAFVNYDKNYDMPRSTPRTQTGYRTSPDPSVIKRDRVRVWVRLLFLILQNRIMGRREATDPVFLWSFTRWLKSRSCSEINTKRADITEQVEPDGALTRRAWMFFHLMHCGGTRRGVGFSSSVVETENSQARRLLICVVLLLFLCVCTSHLFLECLFLSQGVCVWFPQWVVRDSSWDQTVGQRCTRPLYLSLV